MIVSHVKAGMELGRAYGLPQTVLEMIPQHHGTRLILYFYHKAKGAEESDQARFRKRSSGILGQNLKPKRRLF